MGQADAQNKKFTNALRCSTVLLGGFGAFQTLQFLAWLESHGLSWRDADFLTGARIAPYAGLARFHAEHAKTPQLNALTLTESSFQGFKYRLDRLLGLGAADICLRYHRIYDVQLDQTSLPRAMADARACASGCQDATAYTTLLFLCDDVNLV
jgi:hypothetical protein